jgi:chromosome segregation protein
VLALRLKCRALYLHLLLLRLSQIKLAGFKSFVDPTAFSLPGQIVGVVGPNGCGKSNVIDALRWVLGESKASALRGATMQDVIFNGSSKRKPVSRASVELVFDNALGKAVGQWSSYAEIAIKRVLTRDGDSKYFINNQQVRRKDVTDIFLGTGLGSRAYAIIEQGMISRIIEAKPEELRIFLEEAAGVSKYRDRRRETELRIADTRDNLLRVSDILQELDKQLIHLGGQAEVAKRYRALETQRSTSQQLFWLLKKQDAAAQRENFLQATEKTRLELDAQTAQLRELESQLETARSSHYQFSDALHIKQGEFYSANADIARLEQQIAHAETQRQRLALQIAQAKKHIEQQASQRGSTQSLLEHWQRQQEGAVHKLAEAEQTAELEAARLPDAENAASEAQQAYQAVQREQLQLQQSLQLADTQRANLQRNVTQIESRRTRLLLEKDNLPRLDGGALQLAHDQAAELAMQQEIAQQQLSDLHARQPHAETELRDARLALQTTERAAAQTEARLQALQQLQNQLDTDKNLTAWLAAQQLQHAPRLWQALQIANGWENALEAVLRERINAITLDKNAVLPLDAPAAKLAFLFKADTLFALPNQALPCLLDFVQCQDAQLLPALQDWLNLVYVADDLAAAETLRATLPAGASLVTRAGHVVTQHSVSFHAPDSQLHGVLARQREIEQLTAELSVQQGALETLRDALQTAEQQLSDIAQKIVPLRSDASAMQQRAHEMQLHILKLSQAAERSAERVLQIDEELAELAELLMNEQMQTHSVDEQMATLREQNASFFAQIDSAQRHANTQDMSLREQRGRSQQAQHSLQEARYFAQTCKDKLADLQQGMAQAATTLAQLEFNLIGLGEELTSSSDADVQAQLQTALQSRKASETSLAEARNALEHASVSLQKLEQARMSNEHGLQPLRDKLVELTLKEQEARLNFEQWATQLEGVDEATLLPLLASGNYKVASLQNELTRLQADIEALGAVNLAALDELQAATERKNYLDAQALDLNDAMATLEDAIRRIDKESRDLLMDTYNKVNEHLAVMFPILFGGGEARLVLTGEEILDSGVQVMAQPPGKKNSSIHLMSGGEKALTAISLVFSLFQLNPAPFCLLDEVDAPLDDSNTERLCKLVKKMSEQTQFVFISHNKIAMEMADQLIGVTMQEKGVSKVVTVDIAEALLMRDEAIVA